MTLLKRTPTVIPRAIPEGIIPLISVEGTAYECGYRYARIVSEEYPHYREYLDMSYHWKSLTAEVKSLVERRAPHLPDIYNGLLDAVGSSGGVKKIPEQEGCTSFSVSGSVTLDGQPISGQTKDTVIESAYKYIVLRMRIKNAPTILVLAYPGEVLGYGMWSNGISIFRNALHSRADSEKGLTMVQWGLLALAGKSVHEGVELAKEFGIKGSGNFLISDSQGESLSVEYNAGGISVISAKNGIATHANHPSGKETASLEYYPNEVEKENSRYRMNKLWELLNTERGRLTPQKAMVCLTDHTHYPRGICRHLIDDSPCRVTTAAVIAEPTRGRLHVVRGNPCSNWPVTFTV